MTHQVAEQKERLQTFVQKVWREGNLDALPEFWTPDCLNHAMPVRNPRGLEQLRVYHESLFREFAAFSEFEIEIVQQIGEGDRLVTHFLSKAKHTGIFQGIPATGKNVSFVSIRIDRFEEEKIAEHWSVGDVAGMLAQLQS